MKAFVLVLLSLVILCAHLPAQVSLADAEQIAIKLVDADGKATTYKVTKGAPLMVALLTAGGANAFDKVKKVRLIRKDEVRVINLKKVRQDPSTDVQLQDGDTIQVQALAQ